MTDYPNWFAQTAQANFEEFLLPLAGQRDLHFLQLGVYTGDASKWMLDNVLHETTYAGLTDVDTWAGSDEAAHDDIDFDEVFEIYQKKMVKFTSFRREVMYPVKICRTSTVDWFLNREEWNCWGEYDFIYIDADHTTVGVIVDAEMSWPLLKSGGIMAFDDYTWGHESGDPRLAPQVGIDLFLHRHQLDYQVLAKNTQVWIRKK